MHQSDKKSEKPKVAKATKTPKVPKVPKAPQVAKPAKKTKEDKVKRRPSPVRKPPTKPVAKPTKKPVVKKSTPLYVVVRAAVFNILGNTTYVLEACKCKTIMPAHLKAVAMIQNTIMKNKIGSLPSSMKKDKVGGAQVMPSEYYGVDSGRYFDISQVQSLETHMFADAALSRAELPFKVGGGMGKLVSSAMVKQAVKQFNEAQNKSVKVSKDALEMIRMSAEQNVKDVQAESGRDATVEQVRSAISQSKHLSHLRI